MYKFLSIFKISLQQEMAYKANFIMARVRSVLQIFLVFFLWDTIFSDPGREVLGYTRAKILTYVFGILVMQAIVLTGRSTDIPGEISQGRLTSYLLKPVDYFKYWLARDMSAKVINISFAVVEIILLYFIIRPPLFLQTDPLLLVSFAIFTVFSVLMFFLILFITSMITFWMPEMGWPAQFLVSGIIIQFFSGAMFPLDVLPAIFQNLLYLTPFPYLLFYPLQIYLGKFGLDMLVKGFVVSSFWLIVLFILKTNIWNRGLRVYRSEGQ